MAVHNDLGKAGEEKAVALLRSKGYDILAENYTYNKGEIDIIARMNNTIAIIEVKTRSTIDFGDPQSFLKPAQMKRLVATADHFIKELPKKESDGVEIRFDIIAVISNKSGEHIEHLVDAFYHF